MEWCVLVIIFEILKSNLSISALQKCRTFCIVYTILSFALFFLYPNVESEIISDILGVLHACIFSIGIIDIAVFSLKIKAYSPYHVRN